MKKIEYKIMSQTFSSQPLMEKWLNEQGQEGWDLFSINSNSNLINYFIFKREILPEKKTKIDKTIKTV